MALLSFNKAFLLACLLLILVPAVSAFGAGNIASISKIEGINWRHGDIEDMLKNIAFLHGQKWTSNMIKRVYFGNWLRDYSQAIDVGSLKGVQKDSIRIIVWVLSFMGFGYATAEFEVTEDRLGTYQAHEHIDNPKGYPDDAQKYDPRLRPPVAQVELAVDPNTGMKNYIANESGGWATSTGYIKFSLNRSIHFGRIYTSGTRKGQEKDLFEALRCLGQALHTLEDFSAHSNYTELALREMGYHNVFPHCGTATEVTVRGKRIYPITTGTFGGLDFVLSVIGEAGDHVAQSEVDEVNTALYDAVLQNKRGLSSLDSVTNALSMVPGTGGFIQEARDLQAASDAQTAYNDRVEAAAAFSGPPGTAEGGAAAGIPGMKIDPVEAMRKIYPILQFHDAVVRTVSNLVEKIPGLERVLEYVQEKVTLFVMALIAPFVQPIIKAVTASLKLGNNTVVDSSKKTQFEVWTDPQSSDPTHSMLSKDHFSNILNEPAGLVAAQVVEYVAPRVLYAWQHPDVPVDQVMDDVCRVFHHPALRDHNLEIHRNMYSAVEQWVQKRGGSNLNNLLSSESVKAGRNHIVNEGKPLIDTGKITSNIQSNIQSHINAHIPSIPSIPGFGSHSKLTNSPLALFNRKRELGFEDERPDMPAGSFEAMSSVLGNHPQQGYQPEYGAQPAYGQQPFGQPSPQPAQYSYPFAGGPQPGYGGGYQQGPYGQQPPGQYPGQQPPAQYPGQQPPGQYPGPQGPYGQY